MIMIDELTKAARKLGEADGGRAASWYFDGNTSQETYQRVLTGLEDCDPAIADTLPLDPLSSGDLTADDLYTELGVTAGQVHLYECSGELDVLCTTYVEAYHDGYVAAVENACHYHLYVSEGATG